MIADTILNSSLILIIILQSIPVAYCKIQVQLSYTVTRRDKIFHKKLIKWHFKFKLILRPGMYVLHVLHVLRDFNSLQVLQFSLLHLIARDRVHY